jgi:NADH-quinone oxidoreductase subunit H
VPWTDIHFHLYMADSNVALLFVAALGSLGFYGLLIGGWASGSKYSLLGGMRAIAQLVSYEVAFTLAVIGVVIHSGSLSFIEIAQKQDNWLWYIVPQFLGFLVFMVAAVAESNRPPFDLAEADGEVVAGYHTEYGGMRFGLFSMSEYINLITLTALCVTLFLGGWHGPWFPGPIWFLIKLFLLLFVFIWVRTTVPRLRYDQLMRFGWKVLLPIATLNAVITAILVVAI